MRLLVSGTTRSLAKALAKHPESFGRLLTPSNRNSIEAMTSDGFPWACDNGCFNGLDEPAFRRMLRRVSGKPGLLWVCAPDVVGSAVDTLRLLDVWEPVLRAAGVPIAFVGQDGQERLPVPWSRFDAFFVGGTTEWKMSDDAAALVVEAKERGKLTHMGRVNSRRRLRYAFQSGCDSVDGSGFSRWGDAHLLKFARWLGEIRGELFGPVV